MLNFEKYNKYLEAFKYARFKHKDSDIPIIGTEFTGENSDIPFACIFLEEYEGVEVEELSGKIEFLEKEAEREFIANLYSIPQLLDKAHYINKLIGRFIKDVLLEFRAVRDYIEDAPMVGCSMLSDQSLYVNYINDYCWNNVNEWLSFIGETIIEYNLEIEPTWEVYALLDTEKCLRELLADCNIYPIFRNYKSTYEKLIDQEEGVEEYSGLKAYFKVPAKYDEIMALPVIRKYFDEQGKPHIDTQKAEISSFLHFLHKNNYLKDVPKDKDLYKIGKLVFNISESIMQKREGKQYIEVFFKITANV